MNVSTEQLILDLHISRNDVGVYTWTAMHAGTEVFDHWDEPEISIEACLLAASNGMPENAIVWVRYRGIPIKAYRGDILNNEAATVADAVVAMYADLVDQR